MPSTWCLVRRLEAGGIAAETFMEDIKTLNKKNLIEIGAPCHRSLGVLCFVLRTRVFRVVSGYGAGYA